MATRTADPVAAEALDVRGVLLASEDGRFPRQAVEAAARLARRSGAPVHVLSIARVWGTSFGFPSPGLMPTKAEWADARARVGTAVQSLERRGINASGEVIGTRAGAKRIVRAAREHACDVIVMAAEPPRNRFVASFLWSQEPYRVRRRAPVPVVLVPVSG